MRSSSGSNGGFFKATDPSSFLGSSSKYSQSHQMITSAQKGLGSIGNNGMEMNSVNDVASGSSGLRSGNQLPASSHLKASGRSKDPQSGSGFRSSGLGTGNDPRTSVVGIAISQSGEGYGSAPRSSGVRSGNEGGQKSSATGSRNEPPSGSSQHSGGGVRSASGSGVLNGSGVASGSGVLNGSSREASGGRFTSGSGNGSREANGSGARNTSDARSGAKSNQVASSSISNTTPNSITSGERQNGIPRESSNGVRSGSGMKTAAKNESANALTSSIGLKTVSNMYGASNLIQSGSGYASSGVKRSSGGMAQGPEQIQLSQSGEEFARSQLQRMDSYGKRDSQNVAFLYDNLDEFQGTLRKNKPHGYGIYTFTKQKLQYRGNFVDGVIDGEGYLFQLPKNPKDKPEQLYFGEWKDGKKHGKGKYSYGNGKFYEGIWEENKKEGLGDFTSPEEGHFNGQWRNDKRDGRGVLRLRNGIIFDGSWVQDEFVEGKVNYPNGDTYDGKLKNFKRHGRGTYVYANKESYRGDWLEDMKTGKGEILFLSGDSYLGSMQEDSIHGNEGKYRWNSGYEVTGTFNKNAPASGILEGPELKPFKFSSVAS